MLYKIKNPVGKFSKGGMDVRFSKKGKIWSARQFLISHFRLLEETIGYREQYHKTDRAGDGSEFGRAAWIYEGCTIIEIDETGVLPMKETTFREWIINYMNEKADANQKSPE